MHGRNEQQLRRDLRKLFMQGALGRLQIQEKRKILPRGINGIFFIYDKRNLGYTPHKLLTAHEHLYAKRKPANTLLGLGRAQEERAARGSRVLARLPLLLLFQVGPVQVSPLPATRALCRHSEHLHAFPAFIQAETILQVVFTYQTSSSCLSLPSSSGNGSVQ